MELKGEHHIAAPREKVWAALNDPNVLRACIPGCETLSQSGENGFDAVVMAKVGPVKARFSGAVQLSNIKPPESYTISGEGKGGAAGMAKGGADVVLVEDGDGTLLKYTVMADVGGRLAQIGSRLIASTANKYARDFFARFGDIVTGKVPLEDTAATAAAVAAAGGGPVAIAIPGAATSMPSPQGDPNAAHIRRLNWVLLATNIALVTYLLLTLDAWQ